MARPIHFYFFLQNIDFKDLQNLNFSNMFCGAVWELACLASN